MQELELGPSQARRVVQFAKNRFKRHAARPVGLGFEAGTDHISQNSCTLVFFLLGAR